MFITASRACSDVTKKKISRKNTISTMAVISIRSSGCDCGGRIRGGSSDAFGLGFDVGCGVTGALIGGGVTFAGGATSANGDFFFGGLQASVSRWAAGETS